MSKCNVADSGQEQLLEDEAFAETNRKLTISKFDQSSKTSPIWVTVASQARPKHIAEIVLILLSICLTIFGLIFVPFLASKWVPDAALGALRGPSGTQGEPKEAQDQSLVDLGWHFGSFWRHFGSF